MSRHEPHPRIAERKESGPHLVEHERESLGFNGRLAVWITYRFGSMWAFYVLVVWMFVWMALASAQVWLFRKDPYPFPFLLFLSNLVQLFALPVIMVGQHVLSMASDKQAMQTFRDTEAVLQLTDEIHRLTKEIHAQLGQPKP